MMSSRPCCPADLRERRADRILVSNVDLHRRNTTAHPGGSRLRRREVHVEQDNLYLHAPAALRSPARCRWRRR
ncbi:MAG: hypothetical protein U0521_27190 [Anaerolineae bacterium]